MYIEVLILIPALEEVHLAVALEEELVVPVEKQR